MNVISALRPLPRDRPWYGIAAGAALFGLAAAGRWQFGDLTEGFGPMLLLPPILLAGLIGGIRVGVGVAVACFLVAWIWFFPPYGSFALSSRDAVAVVAFILIAALELYVIRVMNITINDLSLAEKRSATMFRELQHRVANNLQGISSILSRERNELDCCSAAARALERAQERLNLMARVHRNLHSPSIVELPIGSYLKKLGDDLIKASDTPQVHLKVTAVPIILDVERLMSLSMIVAEAITNSLKYAFHSCSGGTISISITVKGRVCSFAISDDGPGFSPPDLNIEPVGLGRGIIEALAFQLCGKLSFESEAGAAIRVVFPI